MCARTKWCRTAAPTSFVEVVSFRLYRCVSVSVVVPPSVERRHNFAPRCSRIVSRVFSVLVCLVLSPPLLQIRERCRHAIFKPQKSQKISSAASTFRETSHVISHEPALFPHRLGILGYLSNEVIPCVFSDYGVVFFSRKTRHSAPGRDSNSKQARTALAAVRRPQHTNLPRLSATIQYLLILA